MTDDEKAAFTSSVFVRLVTENKTRLAHGMRIRKKIHDTIDRGDQPEGYRVEWLRSSATQIVNLLHDIGEDFNAKHTEDRVSVHDLMDVLATTLHLLRSRAGLDDDDNDDD